MQHTLVFKMLIGFASVTAVLLLLVAVFASDFSSLSSLFQPSDEVETSRQQVPVIPTIEPQPILGKSTDESKSDPVIRTETAATTTIIPASIYSLINAHRKEQNLSSLRIETALELSARKKLEDMKANNYWRHENTAGVMDWSIFEQSGYHYKNAGENLSFGNNTPWNVFSSWVASPQHNEQLLKPEYEDMGLAVDCSTYQEGSQSNCAVVLHLGRKL